MGLFEPRLLRVTETAPERKIGRLYNTPLSACASCGSRVLELLYCYECGDVSLGGFIVPTNKDYDEILLSPGPVTEDQSGKLVFQRPATDFFWYRPGVPEDLPGEWTKDGRTSNSHSPLPRGIRQSALLTHPPIPPTRRA